MQHNARVRRSSVVTNGVPNRVAGRFQLLPFPINHALCDDIAIISKVINLWLSAQVKAAHLNSLTIGQLLRSSLVVCPKSGPQNKKVTALLRSCKVLLLPLTRLGAMQSAVCWRKADWPAYHQNSDRASDNKYVHSSVVRGRCHHTSDRTQVTEEKEHL